MIRDGETLTLLQQSETSIANIQKFYEIAHLYSLCKRDGMDARSPTPKVASPGGKSGDQPAVSRLSLRCSSILSIDRLYQYVPSTQIG